MIIVCSSKFFNILKYSIAVLFILSLKPGTAYAQSDMVPSEIQAKLFPKIILMNKNFNAKQKIKIGLVYNPYSKNSIIQYTQIKEHIRLVNNNNLFEIFEFNSADTGSYHSKFIENEIDVIFVTSIRGFNYENISRICKELRILTFSSDPDLVEQFFSVSYKLYYQKPKIVINHQSSKNEGADFSSRLLKNAIVLDF